MADFNSDALERAAKFAKELEKSKHAKEALELTRRAQNVDVKKANAELAKEERMRAEIVRQQEQQKYEEQRKTLQFQKDMQIELEKEKQRTKQRELQEADRLARARDDDRIRKQNEAAARREAMRRKSEEEIQATRRKTDEFRAQLERKNMEARAVAEAKGRMMEMRENEDIFARQAELKAKLNRETSLQQIKEYFASFRETASEFASSPTNLVKFVGFMTALAAGVFVTREGARVAGRVIEKRLGVPSLVRETSLSSGHFSMLNRAKRALGLGKVDDAGFAGVVLEPGLDGRIKETGVAVRNTRSNGANFRHMLFYGPPGTGKTMVAKRLARSSGLDYAIMSGGDVGPLGRDGVTELHKLFDWSGKSSRGLLLFIDEADAFLASRSKTQMSEDQRNALNALLYRTGEASGDIMMVLATNRPGDLDRAVTDRVDEALLFGLPGREEREALLRTYFHKYIVDAGKEAKGGLFGGKGSARISVGEGIDDEYFADLADRTTGFSGRAISKLMLSVQGTVYGRAVPILTKELMEEVVDFKLAEHNERDKFAQYDGVAADGNFHGDALPASASAAADGGAVKASSATRSLEPASALGLESLGSVLGGQSARRATAPAVEAEALGLDGEFADLEFVGGDVMPKSQFGAEEAHEEEEEEEEVRQAVGAWER